MVHSGTLVYYGMVLLFHCGFIVVLYTLLYHGMKFFTFFTEFRFFIIIRISYCYYFLVVFHCVVVLLRFIYFSFPCILW